MRSTAPVRPEATVHGGVPARADASGADASGADPSGADPSRDRSARRGLGVAGLVRAALRLGGRAHRPASAALGAALPAALAVAGPVARAVVPAVPLAARLAAPLTGPRAAVGRAGGRDVRPRPVVALRVDGRDQPVVSEVLERLDRDGSGRLLVLVPASGSDERTWQQGVAGTGATYADRLADLLGWSPITVRYDAGEPLPQAAPALAALLQRVVDGWPVPVSRIVLVAAGDGGLLARGALGLRQPGPRPWSDLVSELVALGTPHLGSDAAAAAPVVGGVGRRLERELAGVVVAGPEVRDVPPLDHVHYLLVADRATARTHPAGQLLAGALRRRGRARTVHDLFPTAERFEVATAEQPLVNHPEVHDALLRWLA